MKTAVWHSNCNSKTVLENKNFKKIEKFFTKSETLFSKNRITIHKQVKQFKTINIMRQSNNINPNTNNDFITDMNGNPVKRIKVRLVSREEYERIMKERENK